MCFCGEAPQRGEAETEPLRPAEETLAVLEVPEDLGEGSVFRNGRLGLCLESAEAGPWSAAGCPWCPGALALGLKGVAFQVSHVSLPPPLPSHGTAGAGAARPGVRPLTVWM